MDDSRIGLVTTTMARIKTGLDAYLAEITHQNLISTIGQFLWRVTKYPPTPKIDCRPLLCGIVIKESRASGYTVYLLVNTILRNALHLHTGC